MSSAPSDATTPGASGSGSPGPAGWDRVVGQDAAVTLLQHIAARPAHAYLLVGPRGSGVEEAARCFAAAVVAPDDARSFDLALRGVHPDVVEIDPAANQIRVEDAQAILDEAYRSPIEGARKVILVFEAERLNEQAANKLLKTLEEPPDSAMIVLVTSGADQLLSTIRSRCQRVDFAHLSTASIAAALVRLGFDAASAARFAGLSGGTTRPRRGFGTRLGVVRDAFVDTATSCDGSGAHVARSVSIVQEAMQVALTGVETAQADELAHLTVELETSGYPDRVVRTQLRRLEAQHKRAHRRAAHRVVDRGDHRARDGVSRRAGRADQPRPQLGSTASDAGGEVVQPGARRLPRRSAGPRRVQPQRDVVAGATVPAPPGGAALISGNRDDPLR